MEEAISQARSWNHPSIYNCHPDARLFLCSLFSPICVKGPNNYDIELPPCNPLCQEVKDVCQRKLSRYNLNKSFWDTFFNCDRFTIKAGMCVSGQHSAQSNKPRSSSSKSTSSSSSGSSNSNSRPSPPRNKKPSKDKSVSKVNSRVSSNDDNGQCRVCDNFSRPEIKRTVCSKKVDFIVTLKDF